jgi:type II secretory pathway pseudopilin PulG
MIELVVVMVIIGVLMAILVPAIGAARQAARIMQCKNNLRQIGLGLHSYVDVHRMFPPTNNNTSWSVSITPFVEQHHIFQQYDHSQPFNAAVNAPLGTTRLQIFSCPGEHELRIPPTNLVAGNVAMNVELSGLSLAAVTDGLSNTGVAVEITSSQQSPWSAGGAIIFGSQDVPHRTVLNVVRADGSVIGISAGKLEALMPLLGTPSGGETGESDQ